MKRPVCTGCGEEIEPGKQVSVTVTSGRHVITVTAHEEHRDAAWANTMADSSWKRDQSHYAG
jgi:RNase P subunit RPR2